MRIRPSTPAAAQKPPSASAVRGGDFSGRKVSRGEIPPARRNLLARLQASIALRPRSLRRGALAFHQPPTGLDGKNDGRGSAAQLLRPGLDHVQLLNMARCTAVLPSQPGGAAIYSEAFMGSFGVAVKEMSDLQVRIACKRVDGPAMRDLRAALREAAAPPPASAAPRDHARAEQVKALADNLDLFASILRVESCERGLGTETYEAPKMPEDKAAAQTARAQAKAVGESIMQGVQADAGDFPPALRDAVAAEYQELSGTAEQMAAPCDREKPDGEKLAAPEIFFSDFARQTVHCEGGTLMTRHAALHGKRAEAAQRQEISQTLVEYCRGNENQARRLGRLVNQEAIALIYTRAAQGALSHSPYPGESAGIINWQSTHNYQLQQAENGDIHVCLREAMVGKSMMTPEGENLPLDDRKSKLTLEVNFTVPARPDAAPEIGACTYEGQMTAGQVSGLETITLPDALARELPGTISLSPVSV